MLVCVLSFFCAKNPQSNTFEKSLITDSWPNAPININAAYENPQSGRIFLFKGKVLNSQRLLFKLT